MTVTAIVDLTAGLLPLRNQGTRPTCMAIAFSELHQFAKGLTEHLSAEYLYRAAARRMPTWVPDAEGLSLGSGVDALANDGQPIEVACPYQPQEPVEMPPALPILGSGSVYTANSSAAWMDLDAVTDRIKDGKPVGVLVHVTDTFLDPKSDIVADSTLVPTSGSHAVVAAGYGTHKISKEPHVLVRNSWGPNWGKQGMAWLPRAYLLKHGIAYFEVQ